MLNGGVSEYFAETREGFLQSEDKERYLSGLAGKFGFSNVTYFFLSSKTVTGSPGKLLTTYAKDWQSHYFSRNYDEIDPILLVGMKSFLPVDWAMIPKAKKRAQRFFGEAMEFGISDRGVTVPVRGVTGETALVSLNAEGGKSDWTSYLKHHMSDITYFAFLLHGEILESIIRSSEKRSVTLTKREKQVLEWAAEGKTSWDTATILGLSYRTVEFYIGNAASKLGTVTKTQTVSRAMSYD